MKAKQAAYLAGIVDGEGTIALSFYKSKPDWISKGGNHVRAIVSPLTNTDAVLVSTVMQILKDNGFSPRAINLNTEAKSQRWKPAWRVEFKSIEERRKFVKVVRPYLMAKREQADIVLEFLGPRSSKTKVKTSEYERLLALRCKALNQRGRASESVTTERQAGDTPKSQSELHGDMQNGAEMTSSTLVN